MSIKAMVSQMDVFGDISGERARQDNKWGPDRNQNGFIWQAILSEEVGEVAREVLERDNEKLYTELIQVAAVAVAWAEAVKAKRFG